MKCGMCNKEIPEEVPTAENRCGACAGGCRKVHCPYCGYGNPLTPGYLKTFASKKADEGKG